MGTDVKFSDIGHLVLHLGQGSDTLDVKKNIEGSTELYGHEATTRSTSTTA
jgi:hypothetical protein